jgi:hypothetical protein
MIKALSLAAALAVLPFSAAVAGPQESAETTASPEASPEAAIEAASARFEARMEDFGARAEAIGDDETLTDAQRGVRIAALWGEYAPDVQAFTAVVTEHASAIAGQALAEVDIEAVVAEALAEVENSGALAAAGGMAANGAWASNDPEHMATYGLVAEYALGEALDGVEEVTAQIDAATAEIAAETAAAPATGTAD